MESRNGIFIIDGTPGSGRSTLANRFEEKAGWKPVRLGGLVSVLYRDLHQALDFHNTPRRSEEKRNEILNDLLQAYLDQFNQAARLHSQGHTPVLDGSLISLIASMRLGGDVAGRFGLQYVEYWMRESEEKARKALLEHPALDHVAQMFITLRRHQRTRDNPRSGITGLEEQEVKVTAETADSIAEERGIQILALDFDEGGGIHPWSFTLYSGSYPIPQVIRDLQHTGLAG